MSDATDTSTDETAADEAPALPGDGLREGIVADLRADLGEHLVDSHLMPQRDLWVRVATESWAFTGQVLSAHGFEYFCFLSAIDWLPSPYGKGEDDHDAEPVEPDTQMRWGYTGGETRFQLFARVTDLRRHVGVTVKCDVPDSMTMPTWIRHYAGANWHERETHEMFGIGFDGHPDLRNLYLPGAFEGFPLRKDFPLLSRMVKPWPGIVDVEPMPERAEEVGDTPISADGEPMPEVETPADEGADAPGAETDEATAAGDAVEAATAPDADASTAEQAESGASLADDTAPGEPAAGEAEVEAADETEPTDPVPDEADTGVVDPGMTDDADDADADADADDASDDVVSDGSVDADLGPGTVTESTDADAEAPTPGEGVDPTDERRTDERRTDERRTDGDDAS